MWTLLLNLAFAESTSLEPSLAEAATEPFTFTPSIYSIAESEVDETDTRYQPADPSALTTKDAYRLSFDAARHNLDQRAEIGKRTLIYSLIEGTSHGVFVGATLGWGLYASLLPHLLVNNIVVFIPVVVQYDETFDPEQQNEELQKSYVRGYRQYHRLRKRAIIIPVQTGTFLGGFLIGTMLIPEGVG